MVTLMIENFFSFLRQDDPLSSQLQYGVWRVACVRESEKQMYWGHFSYFTSPKSLYPNKEIDATPPPQPLSVSLIEEGVENLSLDKRQKLCEFASAFWEKRASTYDKREKQRRD